MEVDTHNMQASAKQRQKHTRGTRCTGRSSKAGTVDVGGTKNTLHRLAKVVPTTLPIHHILVDLARRDVRVRRECDVEEPLVVAKVEVALTTVVEHIHLTVLVRGERTGVFEKEVQCEGWTQCVSIRRRGGTAVNCVMWEGGATYQC